jgi:hypothetical protein
MTTLLLIEEELLLTVVVVLKDWYTFLLLDIFADGKSCIGDIGKYFAVVIGVLFTLLLAS